MAAGTKTIGGSMRLGSDFIYDHTCTRCYTDSGSYNEASYYCTVCDVYYCRPCIQYGCDHGILGRADVEKWGNPAARPSGVDCGEHPGNMIQLYCEDHEMVGCYVCMAVNHKPCVNIKYIPQTPTENDNKMDKAGVRAKMDSNARNIEKSTEMLPNQDKSQPLASNVRVTGPGVEHGLISTFLGDFKVETKGAGPGKLSVSAKGPKGGVGVELMSVRARPHTTKCRIDPKSSGLYVIQVRWSEVDVPGSPFHVHICDTQEELERVLSTDSIS